MAVSGIDSNRTTLARAQELTGARTKREVVDIALDQPIEVRSFDAGRLAGQLDAALGKTLQDLADR